MLDRKFILENETLVAENCRNRGVEVDVQKLVALEQQRRQVQADAEEANRLANAASKAIGKAADEAERELRKEEGRKLREEKETLHAQVDSLESQILEIHSRIPNLSHDDAPIGVQRPGCLEHTLCHRGDARRSRGNWRRRLAPLL